MRLSVGVLIAFVVVLTACDSNQGVHQAEVLPTPLPGVVLSAYAHGKCVTDGCPFSYRLRFTNPMDRDVNVEECQLVNESLRLPLTTIAGVEISANGTTTARATYLLPIDKSAANGLVGQPITCTGLDWHGSFPI